MQFRLKEISLLTLVLEVVKLSGAGGTSVASLCVRTRNSKGSCLVSDVRHVPTLWIFFFL